MTTLLQISSSLQGEVGHSSQLANRFAKQWLARNPGARVIQRDLAVEPVPHLDAERFQAFITAADQRSDIQREIAAYSDALIAELRDADAIALGLPLYNFGTPSTLKAYFDHIARAGVTFRYTANGPEGLLADKPVYVLAARGGRYAGTSADTQTEFVRHFLNFIGLKDLHFVYAEGLNIDAQTRTEALAQAEQDIQRLVA